MNKKLPLLAILLFIAIVSNAQSTSFNNLKKVSFIAEAGVDLTAINGESQLIFFPASKIKTGFAAGATVQLKIMKNVFIHAGAAFTVKGAGNGNNVNPDLYNSFVKSFDINYIDIPVTLIYNPSFANGRVFFGAGIFYANALTAKLKYSNGAAANVEFLNYQKVKGLFGGPMSVKPTDYGINALVGYNISHKLFTKLAGQWGLHNISTVYNSDTYKLASVYHTAGITLSLGYRL